MLTIARSGIILHAERYEACVAFYRDRVGLAVEFEKNEPGQVLALMSFGGAYLMLEPGGMARNAVKNTAENPVTLRLNVLDVEAAARELGARGVDVTVSRFEWGVIADFCDPDGNHCQLREAATFAM